MNKIDRIIEKVLQCSIIKLGKDYYITCSEKINNRIRIDDWYIDDTNTVRQSVTSDEDYWEARQDYNKIIASTNPKLGLPNISKQYIKDYIIPKTQSDDVWVEYVPNEKEVVPLYHEYVDKKTYEEFKVAADKIDWNIPKVDEDGNVVIKVITYTAKDMNDFAEWYPQNTKRYSDDTLALREGKYLKIWEISKESE